MFRASSESRPNSSKVVSRVTLPGGRFAADVMVAMTLSVTTALSSHNCSRGCPPLPPCQGGHETTSVRPPAPEGEHGVETAEGERVGQRALHGDCPSSVGHDVQVAARVGFGEI